jgi:hypothetical protein
MTSVRAVPVALPPKADSPLAARVTPILAERALAGLQRTRDAIALSEGGEQRQLRSRRRVTNENRTVQVAGDSGWKHHPERGAREPATRGLVVSALFFFPRGGSAQVTRSLARALPAAGWQPTLAAGSLGQPGEPTHAASFFAGIDVHGLDYSPALEHLRRHP